MYVYYVFLSYIIVLLLPPYIIQGMTKMGVMPRSRAGKIVAELSRIIEYIKDDNNNHV